jgi:hypothetical protein
MTCKYCSLEYKTKGEKAECHMCHNTFTKKINECLFCDQHYRRYNNMNSWLKSEHFSLISACLDAEYKYGERNQNLKYHPAPKTGKRPYWVYPYG